MKDVSQAAALVFAFLLFASAGHAGEVNVGLAGGITQLNGSGPAYGASVQTNFGQVFFGGQFDLSFYQHRVLGFRFEESYLQLGASGTTYVSSLTPMLSFGRRIHYSVGAGLSYGASHSLAGATSVWPNIYGWTVQEKNLFPVGNGHYWFVQLNYHDLRGTVASYTVRLSGVQALLGLDF